MFRRRSGWPFFMTGDSSNDKKAYELAAKAREALPDDPDLAKALGIVTYRQGDYARAVNLLKESNRNRGGDAQLMYYLGMAQFQAQAIGGKQINASASFGYESACPAC